MDPVIGTKLCGFFFMRILTCIFKVILGWVRLSTGATSKLWNAPLGQEIGRKNQGLWCHLRPG